MAAAEIAVLSSPDRVAQTKSYSMLVLKDIRGDKRVSHSGNQSPINSADQFPFFLNRPTFTIHLIRIVANYLCSNINIFVSSGLNGFDSCLGCDAGSLGLIADGDLISSHLLILQWFFFALMFSFGTSSEGPRFAHGLTIYAMFIFLNFGYR
jgi:hypothetical protein